MQTLNECVKLKNGVVAKIALQPMPKPKADGTYPLLAGRKKQPDIYLTFERDGEPFAKRNWAQVITGEASITLNGGHVLDEDDLDAHDNEGWEILGRYGLFPTVFVG